MVPCLVVGRIKFKHKPAVRSKKETVWGEKPERKPNKARKGGGAVATKGAEKKTMTFPGVYMQATHKNVKIILGGGAREKKVRGAA